MVSLQRMGLVRMQKLGLPSMWHLPPAWGRPGDQIWTGPLCLQQQQLGRLACPAAPHLARSGRAAGRAALGPGRCTAPTPTSRGTAPSGTSQLTARAQWTRRQRSHCCERQSPDCMLTVMVAVTWFLMESTAQQFQPMAIMPRSQRQCEGISGGRVCSEAGDDRLMRCIAMSHREHDLGV